jgi:hypothetical protein
MTEAEYASLDGFRDLPLYEETDERAAEVDKVAHDPTYSGELRETMDLETAKRLLNQADLVPKGGVRHRVDTKTTIFAYFWRKRT